MTSWRWWRHGVDDVMAPVFEGRSSAGVELVCERLRPVEQGSGWASSRVVADEKLQSVTDRRRLKATGRFHTYGLRRVSRLLFCVFASCGERLKVRQSALHGLVVVVRLVVVRRLLWKTEVRIVFLYVSQWLWSPYFTDNQPSIKAFFTGSILDTISARSVKEALGQVTTWRRGGTSDWEHMNTEAAGGLWTTTEAQWRAAPPSNQRVGGLLPALVDVSLSKTPIQVNGTISCYFWTSPVV